MNKDKLQDLCDLYEERGRCLERYKIIENLHCDDELIFTSDELIHITHQLERINREIKELKYD